MDGLTNLLTALSDSLAPVFEFINWIFPLKVYRLDDGDKGAIKTWGCTRSWRNPEVGPGVHFCFMFEEMIIVQAIGGYISLNSQTLMTKDKKMWVVNGAVEYSILNVKQSILETENIESLVEGICMNEIREYARSHDSNELIDSDKLTQALATKINIKVKKHGVKLDTIMITDFAPHAIGLACDTFREVTNKILLTLNKGN